MKKLKPIPEFKNEDEEFEFWSTADSTEYLDPAGDGVVCRRQL